MDEKQKKEAVILRALKLLAAVDWKTLLLVLTAFGGACGAAWNKFEAFLDRQQTVREQEGSYHLLAERMDELFDRMGELEVAVREHQHADRGRGKPSPVLKPVQAPKPAESEAWGSGATEVEVAVEEAQAVRPDYSEPAKIIRYGKAKLPDFQAIQQAAKRPGPVETLEKVVDAAAAEM